MSTQPMKPVRRERSTTPDFWKLIPKEEREELKEQFVEEEVVPFFDKLFQKVFKGKDNKDN